MSVCSFDWELATKFIPIFITFFVYWVWHKQKGKEVLANEAKELLVKLNQLQALSNSISSEHWQRNYENLKENLDKFTKLSGELHLNIELFMDLIKIKTNSDIGDAKLKVLKDENYKSYITTWTRLKEIETVEIELAKDVVFRSLSSYSASNRDLKRHIGKYCMYKL